jgi:Zn-dependent peptidase ImmA (M78 family)
MVEMLEDRGVKVMDLDGPEGFDGLAFWADESIPVIVYSARMPGDRQRFSTAHELAHLLLEPADGVDPEKLAHRFAGAFLFPRERVFSEIGNERRTLAMREMQILKQKYGISMQAIVFRARDLDIISEHGRRTLFRSFSARGWRKREPKPDVPQEKPVRMEQMAAMVLAEDALSKSRVAELLGRELHQPVIVSGAEDDITARSG